jgi:hypothetical protein
VNIVFSMGLVVAGGFKKGFCCTGRWCCTCCASLCGGLVAAIAVAALVLLVVYYFTGATVTEEPDPVTPGMGPTTTMIPPPRSTMWSPRKGRFDRDWSNLSG